MKNLLVSVSIFLVLTTSCAPGTNVQVNTPDSNFQLTAPGPNPLMNQPDANGRVALTGAGLWHGIIAPITLIISFFNPDVQMYEVHNSGSEYNLGFLLGQILVLLALGLVVRLRR